MSEQETDRLFLFTEEQLDCFVSRIPNVNVRDFAELISANAPEVFQLPQLSISEDMEVINELEFPEFPSQVDVVENNSLMIANDVQHHVDPAEETRDQFQEPSPSLMRLEMMEITDMDKLELQPFHVAKDEQNPESISNDKMVAAESVNFPKCSKRRAADDDELSAQIGKRIKTTATTTKKEELQPENLSQNMIDIFAPVILNSTQTNKEAKSTKAPKNKKKKKSSSTTKSSQTSNEAKSPLSARVIELSCDPDIQIPQCDLTVGDLQEVLKNGQWAYNKWNSHIPNALGASQPAYDWIKTTRLNEVKKVLQDLGASSLIPLVEFRNKHIKLAARQHRFKNKPQL